MHSTYINSTERSHRLVHHQIHNNWLFRIASKAFEFQYIFIFKWSLQFLWPLRWIYVWNMDQVRSYVGHQVAIFFCLVFHRENSSGFFALLLVMVVAVVVVVHLWRTHWDIYESRPGGHISREHREQRRLRAMDKHTYIYNMYRK